MHIIDILESKRTFLENNSLEDLEFSYEEIQVLRNPCEIIAFKLSHPVPYDYVPCHTYIECYDKIKDDNSLHRILELCVEYNRSLLPVYKTIMPVLKGIN